MSKTGVRSLKQPTESLADRVCREVRRSIINGDLAPGEPVSISDLASDLEVSYSPVREALQRLAGEGLIVLRPARSVIVAPLDQGDLIEIYRLRKLIEVDAVGRAARLYKADDLAAIEEALEALREGTIEDERFWANHDAFHRALVSPILTPRLERAIGELWSSAERYIRIVYGNSDALEHASTYERHLPLLEAARTKRAKPMRDALLGHLEQNESELVTNVGRIAST